MYRSKTRYEGSMLSLNLMEASYMRTRPKGVTDILFLMSFMVLLVAIGTVMLLPDTTFFALCQNVPGGDVCQINIQ